MILGGNGRVRLRPEHAEHAGILRVITLVMAWTAGIALGLATGDMAIAVVLSMVITAGHLVSWRTRTWRSARWQFVLLAPITAVAFLLVPSLPQAFQGDWLHPMRYLLLLQALASFYLHSRASLYTAQVLSGIVLLVSSQLAIDSLFLFFFFAFFLMQLAFLVAATGTDALRGAAGRVHWPGPTQRAAWSSLGLVALFATSLGVFLLLPWGSISAIGGSGSVLPLTGEAAEHDGPGGQAGTDDALPLTGDAQDSGLKEQPANDPAATSSSAPDLDDAGAATGRSGSLGSSEAVPSPLFGEGTQGVGLVPGGLPGAEGVPDPTVLQVRSPVATYWRGRSYSTYDGSRWLPDRTIALESPRRDERSQYTQTFFLRQTIDAPLFGYSPVAWQPVGDSRGDGFLAAGAVYRSVSERRNFHPANLQRMPANRGPDALVSSAVKQLAEEVTMGAGSAVGKALAITQYLRSNYAYVASLTPWEPAQTVEQFLFGEHAAGTAFDFASAQTALAVAAGLEARLVTGYLPGELDPLSGTYVVRASDAHAWTEVNFRGNAGWVPFDGNPREDGRATATRAGAAGAVAGLFDRRVGDRIRDSAKRALSEMVDIGHGLVGPAALVLLAVAAAFAVRWALRRLRARPPGYTLLRGDGRWRVVSEYRRLERRLRRHVAPRSGHETLDQYFARLGRRFPHLWEQLVGLRADLNAVVYDPSTIPAPSDTSARLRGLVRSIRSENR